MLTFRYTGADGAMTVYETLTSGMVEKEVKLEFSSDWENLRKTAVFMAGTITKDRVNVTDLTTIPHEVLVNAGEYLYVGIYGVSEDGTRITPTIYARGPKIREGADPSGDESTDPALPVWAQLDQRMTKMEQEGTSNGGSGSGQNVDYTDVANKPKINGVELTGDKSLKDLGIGQLTDEQIDSSVNDYLDAHPEATTTVQDGSITEAKLADDVKAMLNPANIFAGKTASFFGDSITQRSGNGTGIYAKWLKELLGLKSYNNYAQGGYKLSDILTKMQGVSDTPDIVFVMGGTNDCTYSTPLGKFGDKEITTIYGSLYQLCKYAKEKYLTQIIVFITPHYQTGYGHSGGITAADISKAMIEVCRLFAIPVYDNYSYCGMYSTNLSQWTDDNVHWNDNAHEMVGRNLAKWMQNHFCYMAETATVTKITATYNQGNAVVYDTDSLDSLKKSLVVTAEYSDGTSGTVTGYSLSGTLVVGTSTVTVSYGGQATMFTVTVTKNVATVESISASFVQGSSVVYDTDSLDTLKEYLTVTASYSNGTNGVVTDYTLSGALTVGTSTITVTYEGLTTTFNVTVTAKTTVEPKNYAVTVSGSDYVGNTWIMFIVDTSVYGRIPTLEFDYDAVDGQTMCVQQSKYFYNNSLDDFLVSANLIDKGGHQDAVVEGNHVVVTGDTNVVNTYGYLGIAVVVTGGTYPYEQVFRNVVAKVGDTPVEILGVTSYAGKVSAEEVDSDYTPDTPDIAYDTTAVTDYEYQAVIADKDGAEYLVGSDYPFYSTSVSNGKFCYAYGSTVISEADDFTHVSAIAEGTSAGSADGVGYQHTNSHTLIWANHDIKAWSDKATVLFPGTANGTT